MRRSRKKRKMEKKTSQQIHARIRFLTRFGVVFNEEMRKRFLTKIQDSTVNTKIEDQSHRVKVHLIEGYKVVYDKCRKEIVTVLPQSGMRDNEQLQQIS